MNQREPVELYRSALIVPVSEMRYVRRAGSCGADSITLDLEDGVAESEKDGARLRLPEAIALAGAGGSRVEVRVNHPLGQLVRDIEAAVLPGVSGLRLAKVESAAEVLRVSEFISELETQRGLPEGGIRLHALIESPAGLHHVRDIASADPRLATLGLGAIDFAAACGFSPTPENLCTPCQTLLFAARSAGIRPRGLVGSLANYKDLVAFRELVRRSREMGFTEGGAIHPSQIPVLNEEMGLTSEEISEAREIVALAEEHFSQGRGTFSYRGRMVDKPVVIAARQLLVSVDAKQATAS